MCCARDANDETNSRMTSARDTLIHTIPKQQAAEIITSIHHCLNICHSALLRRHSHYILSIFSASVRGASLHFVVGTIDRFAIGVVNSRHSRTPEHGRWNMRIAEKTKHTGSSLETDGQVQRRRDKQNNRKRYANLSLCSLRAASRRRAIESSISPSD